ncbi:hypothetical protein AVEN_63254-1 [Araneus ventricosus]|uniref:Uncharacterized protein n=1 Tax=Araneus ventricosus TaxID=182803 RepID=A0A4Y2B0U1_ARAVE|nr:hypothetical protein AVEN_63254-1 [Araneus ventricosus]
MEASLVQLYLHPVLKQREGYFGTDLVILNRGQMTKATPELAASSPSFHSTPAGGHLASTDLTCTRLAYMAVLRWNRVSNLEISSPKVETLPPGHRGFKYGGKINGLKGK